MSDRWFMPIAGIMLLLGFSASIIAALATADWRYLIFAVICYVMLAAE